uniref:Uncharacterized protein n=1 Tax=Rhizophora mucronata TaxID=61149 RepID=A0A2P2IIM3_RHIMU
MHAHSPLQELFIISDDLTLFNIVSFGICFITVHIVGCLAYIVGQSPGNLIF